VRDLVETALGALLLACLSLAALILPCALIDMAAGTNLLHPVALSLLLAFSAVVILGVVVAMPQRRHSDDNSGHRSLEKKGSADSKGNADRDYKRDWRRR
jgi:hypothetical protein